MDKDKVGELEALLARATPGPWSWSENGNILGHMPNGYDETREVCAVYTNDEATGAPNAPLIIAMHNALPELLRVYRAWQGAAVVEIDTSGEEVRLIAVGSALDNAITAVTVDSMHGTRVRLLPDQAAA